MFLQENIEAVLVFAGVSLTVVGVITGHLLTSRAAGKANEHTLIDQLQEELKDYRAESSNRASKQDERLERLENHGTLYREYIHELRDHIDREVGPPSPPWPVDVPR